MITFYGIGCDIVVSTLPIQGRTVSLLLNITFHSTINGKPWALHFIVTLSPSSLVRDSPSFFSNHGATEKQGCNIKSNQSIYWFSLLVLTTATTISTMSSCKFVFPQIMSSPSFHISFHSWIKMNSTNWPALDLWAFIAQLVEHCDHCSANDNCNDHTIFTDFRCCNNEPLNEHIDCFNCILRQDL